MPKENPSFAALPLPAETTRMLRYTEGTSAEWRHADGTQWQFFYFRWAPGRTAVNLARNHTPEICLPAAGHKLMTVEELSSVRLGDLTVPFRGFIAGQNERPLFVFYALWEDGAAEHHSQSQSLIIKSRMNAVRMRRRNPGQRSIEIAISGARDLAEAQASLQSELPKPNRTNHPVLTFIVFFLAQVQT